MTTNLGAPQVAPNQDQKEQTINDAVGRLDASLTDAMILFIEDDVTITADQFRSHGQFDLQDSGIAANFGFTVPAGVRRGMFIVTNETGHTATIGVPGQSGAPTLATAEIALLFCDGATVRLL